MAWSYDETDLNTATDSGRLNTVRLMIGDTDTNDQQLQDEEIEFALSENGDNVYNASSFACRLLATKYSRLVDTQLDGVLEAYYSQRVEHYRKLSTELSNTGKIRGGRGLGVYAGGINSTVVEATRKLTNRVQPAFHKDKYSNPPNQVYWEDE